MTMSSNAQEHPAAARPGGLRIKLAVIAAWLLAVAGTAAAQASWNGTYSDTQLQMQIQGGPTAYSGTLTLGGQAYPFSAQVAGDDLRGTFQAGGASYVFTAAMRGTTLELTTDGFTYYLQRLSAAPPPDTGGFPAPGTQLTYRSTMHVNPGANAPPDRVGSAGEAWFIVTFLAWNGSSCVANVDNYSVHTLDRSIEYLGQTSVLGQGDECDVFWVTPDLARTATPSETEQIQRGQWTHGGRQYDAVVVTVNRNNGAVRVNNVFDMATGVLLSRHEGHGDPNWTGAGTPTVESSIQNWELVDTRQLSLPWSISEPLPQYVGALQTLTYRGMLSQALPGSYMLPPTEYDYEVVHTFAQSHPTWVELRNRISLTLRGYPGVTPIVNERRALLSSVTDHFIPPAALAAMRPGQVLDVHPVLNWRYTVESVAATGVVLSRQMPGYNYRATYDPGSGILVAASLETVSSTHHDLVTLQLVDYR